MIFSSGLVMITDRFCCILVVTIQSDIGPPGVLYYPHSVGLRLVALLSVTGGLDQSSIVDLRGQHQWTPIMFWFVLAFVYFLSTVAPTRKPLLLPR